MKKTALLCLVLFSNAVAQDLTINNGRIVDGTGRVIEQGSITASNGRITSIAETSQEADIVIDARGMTVMPGLIDTHVHLITGPAPASYDCADVIEHLDEMLAALLGRGFTTIMSPGDQFPDIMILRERIADRTVTGPRLLAVGPVGRAPNHPRAERENFCNSNFTGVDEQAIRAEVKVLAEAGVDGIKILYDSMMPPLPEDGVVAAIASEAHAHDIPLMAHVQTVEDALRAVQLGVDRLAHVPTIGPLTSEALTTFATARVPMSSTIHLIAPIRRPGGIQVNHGERQYTPDRLESAEARLAEALVMVRTLWDAGIPIAFGTDAYRGQPASQDPWVHEIETLGMILSPSEVIAALTINGATYLNLEHELGSLEPGKVADIVIVDGDPLADLSELSKVQLVIHQGQVVVDNR
jgi:enamidase